MPQVQRQHGPGILRRVVPVRSMQQPDDHADGDHPCEETAVREQVRIHVPESLGAPWARDTMRS